MAPPMPFGDAGAPVEPQDPFGDPGAPAGPEMGAAPEGAPAPDAMGGDPMGAGAMLPEPPVREPLIPINEWDNDDVHIEIHELMQKGASYKLFPEPIKKEIEAHVAQHKARRDARMMGLLPPAGPQPGGAYEPGQGGSNPQAEAAGMPGAPQIDNSMLGGTGPAEAQ